MTDADITVEGEMGLLLIGAQTKAGSAWLTTNVEASAVRIGTAIVCEGSDRARTIVAAAQAAGLHCEVNGVAFPATAAGTVARLRKAVGS